MKVLLPATFVALTLPFAASAETVNYSCSRDSQAEANECVSARYKAMDEDLNAIYGQLMQTMESAPEDQERLRQSQRAWIAFRDADCHSVGAEFSGGSLAPYVTATCAYELTAQRLQQLGQRLTERNSR